MGLSLTRVPDPQGPSRYAEAKRSSDLTSCVNHVLDHLLSRKEPCTNATLCGGLAGELLFLSAVHSCGLRNLSDELARRFDELHDLVAIEKQPHLAFFSGFTGIAYSMEYAARVLGEPESHALPGSVDALVLKNLATPVWRGAFDLTVGLVGYGVYGLSRGDKLVRSQIANLAVERLLGLADKSEGYVRWRTIPRFLGSEADGLILPKGATNLGIAHGNPGVILFLAKSLPYLMPPLIDIAIDAMNRCAEWLCTVAQPSSQISRYAYIDESCVVSRLAWCYGDLGPALALIRAGEVLRSSKFADFGTEIALNAVKRTANDASIRDETLCHGSLGVSLLFSRLFIQTKRLELLHASNQWLKDGLQRLYKRCDAPEGMGALDGTLSCGIACLAQLKSAEFSAVENSALTDWLLL